jgi:prepilin-type N-terminal cleavage/methylation domain-containing protein
MSHSRYAKERLRQALTLLELVVVLGILAVLSTVAVRSLEPIADQARYELTQTVLNDLRLATVGTTQNESSFLGDTGGLPSDVDALLVRPVALIAHSVQSYDSDRDTVNDVTLSSGWNGPYLQLGAGLSEVFDGWGATPTLVASSGNLEIVSLGSDGDSLSPEDGYREDLVATVQAREYLGDVIFRLFAIDGTSGSRIDPSPTGTEQLGVLFYGVNATGGIDGSIAEQMLVVPNAGTFEHRRSNTVCRSMAARAIQWDDMDNDDVLDVGESIVKKSYVHFPSLHPASETRIEMELR